MRETVMNHPRRMLPGMFAYQLRNSCSAKPEALETGRDPGSVKPPEQRATMPARWGGGGRRRAVGVKKGEGMLQF